MAKKRAESKTQGESAPPGPVIHGDVGGDVVGGSKTVTQRAGGDIVGRDKITHTAGGPPAALAEHFKQIQQKIETRPEDPKVEKDEIKDTVRRIEGEAQKGDQANPDKLERWLMNLGAMADDIFQVVAATLANPALGVAKTVQLIAQKAREEKKKMDALSAPGDA